MYIHIDKLAWGTIPTVLVVAVVFGFGEKAGHYGFDWLVPPTGTSHSSTKSPVHDVSRVPAVVPSGTIVSAPTEKRSPARNSSLDAALDAVEMKPVKGKTFKLTE